MAGGGESTCENDLNRRSRRSARNADTGILDVDVQDSFAVIAIGARDVDRTICPSWVNLMALPIEIHDDLAAAVPDRRGRRSARRGIDVDHQLNALDR